ncbi:hypothetical protein B0T24DRAFT_396735 [Lasiosphaeria ovina]|uniref:Uncharacterized protein n=1 Tax=Lasiosphaeria ovina TaxID=92902 RepID=A0AAE0JWH0_9PEZI|nr:hypothetical protein B0T24DRAFT_396735 [Lasiosphaeria ovina]
MAAPPFDASVAGPSFIFDIFNDGQPLRNALALPGGPCNYTDQTLPRCGCRRFWSRLSLGDGFQDNLAPNMAEVCMCSHHACFHEDVPPGQAQPSTGINVAGQENQKPRTSREPLSPVQDFGSFQLPSNLGSSLDLNILNFQSSVPDCRPEVTNHVIVEDVCATRDSPMPDTLNSWENLIQSQPGRALGSPSLCFQQLEAPSTAASSQSRYLRPFAGKGLHTLSGPLAPGQGASVPERGAVPLQNPTQTGPSPTSHALKTAQGAALEREMSQGGLRTGVSGDVFQKLAKTVDSHEQRIDRLESTSFSVAGHEDCHDKHEHADLRVTELESRVEEVEKILNDNGSIASSRRNVRPECADDATASVVSVSTNATILASNRAEMFSQLQVLQAQVSQLQAASLPSYTKPWELEVVFLPFPLRGVWIESHEFPSQRRSTGSNADEWTQMPNTVSRATPDPQSPKFGEWAGQSRDSKWLLPRAFASGRIIDQRLKSRGLIKTVFVRGPDARSIQLAIHDAFGDVLRIFSSAGVRSGYGPNSPMSEFLGLRQPWVPLRKLHKDSRLRFLSPAEMATPALWDFTFLVSSIIMKATGVNRLYVTQPEAYLQDHPFGYQAMESGWSWQKLRELSRVYPDSQSSSSDIPEADAMEECWTWNDRLDEQPSANTSALSVRQGYQQRTSLRSSTSPSQQFFTGVQSPSLSNSPAAVRAQSPMISRERKVPRPLHVRTGSLPPMAPALISPSQSRRRVSSNTTHAAPYERHSSPLIPRPSPRLPTHPAAVIAISTSATLISKRRLGTRSPSILARNTPRWSRSPSVIPRELGFIDERARERRTTPYYATPHSEALPEPRGYRAGSRGPALMPPSNGYDPDDEDDDMDDDFGEDQGSSTDPYDSEMTNDAIAVVKRPQAHESFGLATDPDDADFDIDVYEDEDDGLDSVDTDVGNNGMVWDGFGQPVKAADATHPRPEDVPWAGIEDLMDDGENVDPHSQEIAIHEDDDIMDGTAGDADETQSAASSQAPSEYSSKPNAWPVLTTGKVDLGLIPGRTESGGGSRLSARDSGGFEIHEDGDGLDTRWA